MDTNISFDDYLLPDEHPAESTETTFPERVLWCKVMERFYDDVIEIVKRCNKGLQHGHFDGVHVWYFHEREKFGRYVESEDFEETCSRANVCYWKLLIKFRQLLQLEV